MQLGADEAAGVAVAVVAAAAEAVAVDVAAAAGVDVAADVAWPRMKGSFATRGSRAMMRWQAIGTRPQAI